MCVLSGYQAQGLITVDREHPLTGYKVVRVTPSGRWMSTVNRSINKVWYRPNNEYAAHAIPTRAPGERVGIHAFWNRPDARKEAGHRRVIICLHLWGTVALHRNGYRAQFCKVMSRKALR